MLTIGELIKNERFKQEVSQEKLSEGICTPSYLSRIESGSSNPSNEVIERLMQRLGKNVSRYTNYKTRLEFEIDNLKYSVRRYYAIKEFDKHKEALDKLKKMALPKEPAIKQFIMLHHSFIQRINGANESQLLHNFERALALTKSNIDIENLQDELLTQDEVVLINNIAINIKRKGDIDKCNWQVELEKFWQLIFPILFPVKT
ncbi:helix-turn-helix transcriptional regulator [Proteinivorax tanatarense]|uniref:Helix-turn-helix transcriptional regulator n=1 Tax=Proteinivorax tanatarense TaxID=1260629 RepID=A0AAU7VKS1_9FIRM